MVPQKSSCKYCPHNAPRHPAQAHGMLAAWRFAVTLLQQSQQGLRKKHRSEQQKGHLQHVGGLFTPLGSVPLSITAPQSSGSPNQSACSSSAAITSDHITSHQNINSYHKQAHHIYQSHHKHKNQIPTTSINKSRYSSHHRQTELHVGANTYVLRRVIACTLRAQHRKPVSGSLTVAQ